jgi:hypothetical protein
MSILGCISDARNFSHLSSDVCDRGGRDGSHTVNSGISRPSSFGFLVDGTGGGEDVLICLYWSHEPYLLSYERGLTDTRIEFRNNPFHGSSGSYCSP